jgi:coenzyme F420-dependent glucose-6-phosphate dehydrogenase
MVSIGYMLSSEEHPAKDLVTFACHAEEAGFEYAVISDHYHPWIDRQGESPFVWSVLGAIATRTERIEIGTAVTCPTMRYHPTVVARRVAMRRHGDRGAPQPPGGQVLVTVMPQRGR